MKRWSIGLGALALVAAVPLISGTPVLANLQSAGEAIVQAIRRPEVKLNLSADKKLVELNVEGKEKVTWEALGDQSVVTPGDTLRYTVSSKNTGDLPAKNLVITQPIPPQMVYTIGSTTSNNGTEVTYSIDNGKNFVANPTVKVTLPDGTVEERPAPAEAYTNIRWKFSKALDPTSGVIATYEVTVR